MKSTCEYDIREIARKLYSPSANQTVKACDFFRSATPLADFFVKVMQKEVAAKQRNGREQ